VTDTIVSASDNGKLFGDKTSEELDALLNSMTPEGQIVGHEEAPPVEPGPDTPEPEAPAEEAAPTEEAPPAVEPVPEVDLAASEREGDNISREAMEAKIALLMAHNSRLAGKLGFLEQKLNSPPATSEPYEPQSEAEVDRLTQLERRIEQSEARRQAAEVSQAVAESVAQMDGPWVQELAKEIAEIAPKYVDQIKAAQETTDPALARQIATAVATVVKAEAMQMKWKAGHATMVAQKSAATADLAKAKKAQAPSGSGGVPSPPPKPKTFADMTAAEADAWLRENVL